MKRRKGKRRSASKSGPGLLGRSRPRHLPVPLSASFHRPVAHLRATPATSPPSTRHHPFILLYPAVSYQCTFPSTTALSSLRAQTCITSPFHVYVPPPYLWVYTKGMFVAHEILNVLYILWTVHCVVPYKQMHNDVKRRDLVRAAMLLVSATPVYASNL